MTFCQIFDPDFAFTFNILSFVMETDFDGDIDLTTLISRFCDIKYSDDTCDYLSDCTK